MAGGNICIMFFRRDTGEVRRRQCDDRSKDWSDTLKMEEAKEHKSPLEGEKHKEHSPLRALEGAKPADSLTLAQGS